MRRLLLVEDEAHLRTHIAQCVPWKSLGIDEVSSACCAEEALHIANCFTPDILLTDIRMPGISGLALSAALLKALPDLRIIFMSAYSEADYLQRALRMGSVDYLFKPVQMSDLEEAVSRALVSLEKAHQAQGMATLVEGYADHLIQPLLAHLLEGDQPAEQLAHQLSTLPMHNEQGYYLVILLSSMELITENSWSAMRCLMIPSFAYCRFIPLAINKQAFLCCFEQPPSCASLDQIMRRLSTHLQAGGQLTVQIRFSPITQGLSGLFGFAKVNIPACQAAQRTRVSELCEQMANMIHESYESHSFSAGSIAQNLHYTNAYVCTVFKQKYGLTIHDYLNVYRIAKAKELLENTGDTLAIIAQKVGYENDSYFSRVFKKTEGINPSDYRRRHKRL